MMHPATEKIIDLFNGLPTGYTVEEHVLPKLPSIERWLVEVLETENPKTISDCVGIVTLGLPLIVRKFLATSTSLGKMMPIASKKALTDSYKFEHYKNFYNVN